jgi:glycerol-3-phosphate O-acyltransferase
MESETPRVTARPTEGGLRGWLTRWLTAYVHIDAAGLEQVRQRNRQGGLVYVLRQRSRLDAYIVSWLLGREGLPLPAHVCSIPGRFSESGGRFRAWLRRPFWPGVKSRQQRDLRVVMENLEAGRPVLLFLRARNPGLFRGRRESLEAARPGNLILEEIVEWARQSKRTVHLVPLSVFRGRVFRHQERRLAALAYSVHDAPNDVKKLLTYTFNREDLLVSIGRITDLQNFLERCRRMHPSRVARRLGNSLQRELAQEERAVWGPLLESREVLAERVFEGADVERQVRAIAAERGISEAKAWREARKSFWEMAANFNGFAFGLIEGAFHQIWKRAFSGLEIRGLDRVVEKVKHSPVVLFPCHRSHFDYLVLSYLFRENFLSPPHIHAGDNLAFWPLGPFLRGAGAFFVRRRFDGDALYKLVFHRYLGALIRQGYTLEFFIEGGRSRTGKILTPKLGVLATIVRAFLHGVRKDLYLVPVSIHYGRIAEENAYDAELAGAEKQQESLGALLRARSILRQRHGTVYVSFAEPLSLNEMLGDSRERFSQPELSEETEVEQRRFIQKLGFRLLREVNEATVVGATSLSSTVLLAGPANGLQLSEFAASSRMLAEILRWRGATFTPSLERNLGRSNFAEIIAFLQSSGLIEVQTTDTGVRLKVASGKRTALDFYKNNSIHFFLVPALVAHATIRGVSREDLEAEVWWWLEFFRWEFPLPEKSEVGQRIERCLAYFSAHGAGLGEETQPVPLVRALAGILENFREGYWITARAIDRLSPDAPISDGKWSEAIVRSFEAAQLLGEVVRPEAANPVLFKNATSRLTEMGFLEVSAATKPRDREFSRAGSQEDLARLIQRLGSALLLPEADRSYDSP